MLQQTQVDRVIPYYKNFLKLFPTPQALAKAKLADVLRAWQGLGYNRRAKYLHEAASILVRHRVSHKVDWEELPGVGPYTAKAVRVFAFNQPEVLIETNIRTVFLHEFFSKKKNITDTQLIRYIVSVSDEKNPRQWYWALMDYGAYLKKTSGNANTRSKHYIKQTKFEGSLRQERGRLLRLLLVSPFRLKDSADEKTKRAIQSLIKDGLVKKEKNSFYLL